MHMDHAVGMTKKICHARENALMHHEHMVHSGRKYRGSNVEISLWFKTEDGLVLRAGEAAAFILGPKNMWELPKYTIYDLLPVHCMDDFNIMIDHCLGCARDAILRDPWMEDGNPHIVHFHDMQICNLQDRARKLVHDASGTIRFVPEESVQYGATVCMVIFSVNPLPLKGSKRKRRRCSLGEEAASTRAAFIDILPPLTESSEASSEFAIPGRNFLHIIGLSLHSLPAMFIRVFRGRQVSLFRFLYLKHDPRSTGSRVVPLET